MVLRGPQKQDAQICCYFGGTPTRGSQRGTSTSLPPKRSRPVWSHAALTSQDSRQAASSRAGAEEGFRLRSSPQGEMGRASVGCVGRVSKRSGTILSKLADLNRDSPKIGDPPQKQNPPQKKKQQQPNGVSQPTTRPPLWPCPQDQC